MAAMPGTGARMIICESCTQPFDVAPDAAAAPCSNCGTQNEIGQPDRMFLGATHGDGPATEEERLTRLTASGTPSRAS